MDPFENKKIYFILVMESSKNDLHTFYIRSILLWLIFLLTHLFDRFLNWFIKKWNKSSKLYLSFSLPFLPWNFHIEMILLKSFQWKNLFWYWINPSTNFIYDLSLIKPTMYEYILYSIKTFKKSVNLISLYSKQLFSLYSFLQMIFLGD